MSNKPVLRPYTDSRDAPTVRRFRFHCPGCRYGHMVITNSTVSPNWSWNGDMVRPTFSPSLDVLRDAGSEPRAPGRNSGRCHSFINNGMIQFLSDCWHELKGQTVPLPPIDDADEED